MPIIEDWYNKLWLVYEILLVIKMCGYKSLTIGYWLSKNVMGKDVFHILLRGKLLKYPIIQDDMEELII